MLPSNEFFRNFFCPFDKAKLCHRPYCHYKHADTDLGEKLDNEVEETEYLFDTNLNSNLRLHSKPLCSVDNDTSSYIPTPVDKCLKPTGILKTNNSNIDQPSTSAIPVYNPTPISKLKELNNTQFTDYTPQYSVPVRKRKKIEEYDPTEVKCVSKKSVTFVEPSEVSLHSDCLPTFSSSEDECEDPATAPVFSDDDLDDNVRDLEPPKTVNPPLPVEDKTEDSVVEDLDENNIDEFSLVDKILVDCKKNEKFLSISSKTQRSISQTATQKAKSKKTSDTKKSSVDTKKAHVDVSDIYDCNFNSHMPVSLDSASNSNDSKKSKLKEHSTSSKSSTKTTSKHKSNLETSSLSKVKSISKSSDASKSKEKTSKELKEDKTKRTDDKAKHSKSSSNSGKSNSSSNPSRTEKNKLSTPSEKSSSSSKTSKSGKSDTSESKLSKSKEAKLQDEKVSSSSISKKNKLEQSVKQSNTSDSHSKTKSKNIKEDVSKHSSSKLKKESSGNKLNVEKHLSVKPLSSQLPSPKRGHEEDDSSVEDVTEDVIMLSSDSDPDDECKRIFEETFPENASHSSESNKKPPSNIEKPPVRDVTAAQKKRLAHSGAADSKKPMSNARKIAMKQMISPAQVMYDRYNKIKSLQAEQIEQKSSLAPKRISNSPGRGPEKKRICFAPNQNLLAALEERQKNLSAAPSNDFSPLPSTVSKTLKVLKRVAHVPEVAKARPVIPIDYGSKVPTVVRQKYLNAFIDEYLKFSPTEDEAYDNALEEEKKAYQRSSSKAIYMNVASNALNRLRKRPDMDVVKKNDGVTSTTKTVSHEMLLNGPQAQRTSFSIAKKKTAPTFELKGVALYEQLMEYLLTEDQLKENGYPMPHPTELGRAVIQGVYANKTNLCNDQYKRVCCRCQKTYYVNVDGDYVRDEECDFHWGRLWKKRIAGAFESRYSCCQGDSESDGCCVSIGHVFEGSEAHALKGFVSTLAKTPPPDKYYGIYALDCEMCYTTAGIELTRVSVVGPDHKSVYETFVKPQNKVLDYNTRFSGITEDNLINERTTIRDVQAVLLCMFNSKTILIGHSLESDLKALKIFHKTVVDTSVVFPHKMGLPYKRALRTLMAEKLNKIIQNDVGGHDSCEDAIACMELMIWKIKEDLKGNR